MSKTNPATELHNTNDVTLWSSTNEMNGSMLNHTRKSGNMKYIVKFIFFLCFTISFNSAYTQEQRPGTLNSDKLWGAGISFTYPIADIYMLQASYSLWECGDILCGVAYQDWEIDQGHSHAYTLLLGYRHFLWKGLHTEIELWPAYNPFDSSIDGKTYSGVELWVSARIGYRFDFKLADKDFFILAQPSIGYGAARQNPWPKMEKDNKPIFEPQLIAGFRF
ncbi:MAG TPA: hypothetical protein PLP19_10485 [bacterium]|nr:hypothetical protein [bacterium]